jgi:RecA/RadA recombinase
MSGTSANRLKLNSRNETQVVAFIAVQVFRRHRQLVAATVNKATVTKVKVVENPSVKETKKAVAAVTEKSEAKVSGKVKLG